jgi:MFS family permease
MPEAAPNRRLFPAVLSAASAYTADISIFPIVLASLTKDFDIGHGDSVMLAYAYNLALVAGIVPAYFARTPPILLLLFRIGLAVFALGALLLVVSDSFGGLLLARVLMGLGAGIFSPLIPSIISVTFVDRTRYLSYWATVTGAVCVIAPLSLVVVAQFWALRGAVVLILAASLLALLLGARQPRLAAGTEARDVADGVAASAPLVLLSVLGTIFVVYGQLTWLLYAVPLKAAGVGLADAQLALLGATPWVAFTASSFAMSKVHRRHFPLCLIAAGVFAVVGLALFVLFPAASPAGLMGVMLVAGLSMALANIPSTALAFACVDASKYGLVSCLDILAARLGGAFYLFQFDWSARGLAIVLSSLLLVPLLWQIVVRTAPGPRPGRVLG